MKVISIIIGKNFVPDMRCISVVLKKFRIYSVITVFDNYLLVCFKLPVGSGKKIIVKDRLTPIHNLNNKINSIPSDFGMRKVLLWCSVLDWWKEIFIMIEINDIIIVRI